MKENSGLTRRRLLTGAMAAGAVAVVGTSGALLVNAAGGAAAATVADQFDEVYRGRHIHGGVVDAPGIAPQDLIYIDDDLLHVMRNADGTVSTSINHYQSFDSLRTAAQAAVDTLGDLRPVPAGVAHH
ncbi:MULTISPECIES: tyrosinase family oxidase copper chaperone [Actinokineospora]|nr:MULTISPECIES: tyrosinase family oxidase copper chaperone [Actinokineospora]UVS80279.1 Tyrosinase co-factor MelC1 [Actinokineospora sp. UTMC 2448]